MPGPGARNGLSNSPNGSCAADPHVIGHGLAASMLGLWPGAEPGWAPFRVRVMRPTVAGPIPQSALSQPRGPSPGASGAGNVAVPLLSSSARRGSTNHPGRGRHAAPPMSSPWAALGAGRVVDQGRRRQPDGILQGSGIERRNYPCHRCWSRRFCHSHGGECRSRGRGVRRAGGLACQGLRPPEHSPYDLCPDQTVWR